MPNKKSNRRRKRFGGENVEPHVAALEAEEYILSQLSHYENLIRRTKDLDKDVNGKPRNDVYGKPIILAWIQLYTSIDAKLDVTFTLTRCDGILLCGKYKTTQVKGYKNLPDGVVVERVSGDPFKNHYYSNTTEFKQLDRENCVLSKKQLRPGKFTLELDDPANPMLQLDDPANPESQGGKTRRHKKKYRKSRKSRKNRKF